MHILAILFVLSALVLAFGVIGGMLVGHSQRIITALLGDTSGGARNVNLVTFRPKSVRSRCIRPVSAATIRARQPEALAA